MAAADIDVHLCNEVANQFGIEHRCESLDAVLRLPNLDAIGICTPPASHADLAIAAMKVGKHVWIDKPMALNEPDCRRIITAANDSGVLAMTAFHMRFHRLVTAARAAILRGELGRIESVRLVWHSPRSDINIPAWKTQRETGGGAIVEIAVHSFDLLRFLLGTEIHEIFASVRNGVRDDENAVIAARMSDGVLVTGEFSERTAHEIEIVIAGTEKILKLDCLRFEGYSLRAIRQVPGSVTFRLGEIFRFFKSLPRGLDVMRRGGDYRISYDRAWGGFFDAIRSGGEPLATLHDGLLATRAVRAAIRSMETGHSVTLDSIATESVPSAPSPTTIPTAPTTSPAERDTDLLLSVVIPTFNRPEMLEETLKALARQRLSAVAFEVLVIDDGGTDPLDDLVSKYGKDLRIKLIRQENRGCAPARQTGIDAARGRWLVFTDDDCRPSPDWLSQMLASLSQTPRCAIAGTTVNALQKNLCAEATQVIVRWLIHSGSDARGFVRSAPTCNLAIDANLFRLVGGLSRTWHLAGGEDRDLCARWIEAGHQIRIQPQAQVMHYHALTLKNFMRQHFNYGRGARRFRRVARKMGLPRPRFEAIGSYVSLLAIPFRDYPAGVAARLFGLVVLSQFATVAGILREFLAGGSGKRTQASPTACEPQPEAQ